LTCSTLDCEPYNSCQIDSLKNLELLHYIGSPSAYRIICEFTLTMHLKARQGHLTQWTWVTAEIICLIIPVFQEVKLLLKPLLCSHFHLRWSHLKQQDISDKNFVNLDEIIKMKYKNTLPTKVKGSLRNSLIRSFQKWKGTTYVPPSTHKAFKWSARDPLCLLWQMHLGKLSVKTRKTKWLKITLKEFRHFLYQLKAVFLLIQNENQPMRRLLRLSKNKELWVLMIHLPLHQLDFFGMMMTTAVPIML